MQTLLHCRLKSVIVNNSYIKDLAEEWTEVHSSLLHCEKGSITCQEENNTNNRQKNF